MNNTLKCEICEQELELRPGAGKTKCTNCGFKQTVPEDIYKSLLPDKKENIEPDECQICAGKLELIPQFRKGICHYCDVKQELDEDYCARLVDEMRREKTQGAQSAADGGDVADTDARPAEEQQQPAEERRQPVEEQRQPLQPKNRKTLLWLIILVFIAISLISTCIVLYQMNPSLIQRLFSGLPEESVSDTPETMAGESASGTQEPMSADVKVIMQEDADSSGNADKGGCQGRAVQDSVAKSNNITGTTGTQTNGTNGVENTAQ